MNTIPDNKREAVIQMLKAGHGIRQIVRKLHIAQNTVLRYKRLLENESFMRKTSDQARAGSE